MTEAELNTGTALNAEIVDLTNKIAGINSELYDLAYSIVKISDGSTYTYITADLTQTAKDALKVDILADLNATLATKQAAFDAL